MGYRMYRKSHNYHDIPAARRTTGLSRTTALTGMADAGPAASGYGAYEVDVRVERNGGGVTAWLG